jgi:RNA polymerase sigma factor (sigma-70 family)
MCHRAAALITRDAAAAEDIAQEAFLAALAALDRFDRRRPLGPWLRRIVANRAIDAARARAARREVGDGPLDGLRAPAPAAAPDLQGDVLVAVAALPDAQRDEATRAAARVLVRSDGMVRDGRGPAPEVLRTLQRAVFGCRRLRLLYAARDGEPRRRSVDPVGLVDADGQWYLLATHDGADRTYRVSRIREAEVLDEPAAPTGEVDLPRLWEERRDRFRASMGTLRARIRVRASRRGALPGPVLVDAESVEDGWHVLDVRFGDRAHAEAVLWALAPDAEALAPPDLRAALADRAALTAALHE